MNRNMRHDKSVVIYGASDKGKLFSLQCPFKKTQKDTGTQVTNIFLFSLLTLPMQYSVRVPCVIVKKVRFYGTLTLPVSMTSIFHHNFR